MVEELELVEEVKEINRKLEALKARRLELLEELMGE